MERAFNCTDGSWFSGLANRMPSCTVPILNTIAHKTEDSLRKRQITLLYNRATAIHPFSQTAIQRDECGHETFHSCWLNMFFGMGQKKKKTGTMRATRRKTSKALSGLRQLYLFKSSVSQLVVEADCIKQVIAQYLTYFYKAIRCLWKMLLLSTSPSQ